MAGSIYKCPCRPGRYHSSSQTPSNLRLLDTLTGARYKVDCVQGYSCFSSLWPISIVIFTPDEPYLPILLRKLTSHHLQRHLRHFRIMSACLSQERLKFFRAIILHERRLIRRDANFYHIWPILRRLVSTGIPCHHCRIIYHLFPRELAAQLVLGHVSVPRDALSISWDVT